MLSPSPFRMLAAALSLALAMPDALALGAPSRYFRNLAEKAELAEQRGDDEAAGDLYERAYLSLFDADRIGDVGEHAVLASVSAREKAFQRDARKRHAMVAAEALLVDYLADLKSARAARPTTAIVARLKEVRIALGTEKAGPVALTTSKPTAEGDAWDIVVDGQRKGPLDRAALADAYLIGELDDQSLVAASNSAEATPLMVSGLYADLNQWHVGREDEWRGPMTRDDLLAAIAEDRRNGIDTAQLYVRLEWSATTVPIARAAPLGGAPKTAGGLPSPAVEDAKTRPLSQAGPYPGADGSGTSLVVGGSILMGFGTIAFLTGVGFGAHRWEPAPGLKAKYHPKVWAPPLAVGLAVMVASIPMLAVGAQRNRMQRLRASGAVAVLPMRGGASASAVVRF